MKLFKYISRENCLRLGLFLLLLSAAWVFDRYHDPVAKDQTETGHDQEKVVSTGLLCTLQSPLNLKAPGEKTVYPRADREKWNRFLVRQLKARMSVLRKAEAMEQPHALMEIRNLVTHRCYHYVNPDDLPPLS